MTKNNIIMVTLVTDDPAHAQSKFLKFCQEVGNPIISYNDCTLCVVVQDGYETLTKQGEN